MGTIFPNPFVPAYPQMHRGAFREQNTPQTATLGGPVAFGPEVYTILATLYIGIYILMNTKLYIKVGILE